jgi:hypothetical protein
MVERSEKRTTKTQRRDKKLIDKLFLLTALYKI